MALNLLRKKGEWPPDAREIKLYLDALHGIMAEDMEVYKLVTEVIHLVKPISVLREEPLLSRVEARLSK